MAKGGIAASAVLCFIFSWTEFLFVLTLTQTGLKTVPVVSSTFVTSIGTAWQRLAQPLSFRLYRHSAGAAPPGSRPRHGVAQTIEKEGNGPGGGLLPANEKFGPSPVPDMEKEESMNEHDRKSYLALVTDRFVHGRSQTTVSGLCEAVIPPQPIALHKPEECGYGEIPGAGHQGGSLLAVSKYSKSPDAAWLFMQWATCADRQALITTLGGGTGPTRASVYDDPRVKGNARVGAGTTRHLPVVRETIAKYMGSEPGLPEWAQISSDTIPVSLGKYFAGSYGSQKEAMDDIATQIETVMKG
ncbi:hypothetical protein ATY29_05520 [Rhizobium hidalgonense]|nr:hypothetical protein ATY29_05520 [Rhizobium hidalgonense]